MGAEPGPQNSLKLRMIAYVLIAVVVLLLLVLLAQPKLGFVLIWPILFVYPHLYLERLELLPWNIGVDDLFILGFCLIVIVRCNLIGGVPVRAGFSFLGAFLFFVLWGVANFSGWSLMPELPAEAVVKPTLKCGIHVCFTYALLHTIDTGDDVRRVALVYSAALALAAVTVIRHANFPNQMANKKICKFSHR